MIQLVKYLFIVATVVILAACAAPRGVGPQFSGLVEPANDQGDVYLYRTSAFFQVAMPFEVTLDGNKVGDLHNASYFHLRLSPGKHSIKVSPWSLGKSSEREVQLEPGKMVFLQYYFVTGPLANTLFIGSSIEQKTQEQALLDMKELSPAN